MTCTSLGHISIPKMECIENLILTSQPWFRAFISTSLLWLLISSCLRHYNVIPCYISFDTLSCIHIYIEMLRHIHLILSIMCWYQLCISHFGQSPGKKIAK